MNKIIAMHVKEGSFRRLDDPFLASKSKKYVFYVKIDDVAPFPAIPMNTNPRDQNTNTAVAKSIRDSLESNDGYFHLKNRGIVISAESVTYDNRKEEVKIVFTDDTYHGNVDGGHTYKIVSDYVGEHLDQYVQFEVMTGVEDIIEQLAEARNTSVQVDEKSLAELVGKFEPIKEALEGMPFYNRIAFKQNQLVQDENGKNMRMLDAREIVALIVMFNPEEFDEYKHPTLAYSSKAKMLELYLNEYSRDRNSYRRFINIAPTIFDLYDTIETEFADTYNSTGGRYGRKKYANYKDGKVIGKSKFGMHDLIYKVPDGIIYPTLAAFRCLVVKDQNGNFAWKNGIDPLKAWEETKSELAAKVMSFANSIGDNPNAIGKDSNIWDLTYMTVQRYANTI